MLTLPPSSSSFGTTTTTNRIKTTPNNKTTSTTTDMKRSLTCLSPDGRYVISLRLSPLSSSGGGAEITTHCLPLGSSSSRPPPLFPPISLPPTIVSSFTNEPIEMIYASNQPPSFKNATNTTLPSSSSSTIPSNETIVVVIYTPHAAHLLKIHPPSSSIISHTQPFESLLLTLPSSAIRIVRILSPCCNSRSSIHAIIPTGSLLLCLSDGHVSLCHYNGVITSLFRDATTTTTTDIVDACLFSSFNAISMGVALLTCHGEVYGASPILWEGTRVLKSRWEDVKSRWEEEREWFKNYDSTSSSNDDDDDGGYHQAQYRRTLAERQFYRDAFRRRSSLSANNGGDDGGVYVVARVLGGMERATSWPVVLQGPLVVNDGDGGAAVGLSWMGCHGGGDVYAISRLGRRVDVAVMRNVEVRFGFESQEDRLILDERILGKGMIIERLQLGDCDEQQPSSSSSGGGDGDMKGMQVLMTEEMRSGGAAGEDEDIMMYLADSKGVFAVRTGVLQSFLNEDREGEQKDKEKTDAWRCMTVGDANLCGIVISSDALLGHVLVATLDNGEMEMVNLTAARYIHQSHLLLSPNASPTTLVTTTSSSSANEIPPFLEQITPLLAQIKKTLSSMGHLVGSSTPPSKTDAAHLATVLTFHSQLEKKLALPLSQLRAITTSHEQRLRESYERQKQQLERMRQSQKDIKAKIEQNIQKIQRINDNTHILAERSATTLTVLRELTPTISRAEKDYFEQLKRWDMSCDQWEESQERLRRHVDNNRDLLEQQQHNSSVGVDGGGGGMMIGWDVALNEDEVDMCLNLLRGTKCLMTTAEGRLKQLQRGVERMEDLMSRDER